MIKQYLLSPTCIKCGSFLCNDSLYCLYCFKKEILLRYKKQKGSHLGDQHFYLIGWVKNESDVLSQMIYRLKSNNAEAAWAFYARFIYKKLKGKVDFSKFKYVVPIPGSKRGSVHSHLFAKEISRQTGLPMYNVLLKKTENSEQKSLSLNERRTAVSIQSNRTDIEQFTKCLFVDDVVTTGQSFVQSCNAINADPESRILSLFYRLKQESPREGF